MAKREVLDCDHCDAEDIEQTGGAFLVVTHEWRDGNSVKVDLCHDCMRQVIGKSLMRMTSEKAQEWLREWVTR